MPRTVPDTEGRKLNKAVKFLTSVSLNFRGQTVHKQVHKKVGYEQLK